MKDLLVESHFLNELPNIINVSLGNIAMERHRQLIKGSIIALGILALMILLLFIQNKYLKKKVNIINEELKEQHDWLKITLSSITDGVIAMDIDGKITFINETAKRFLGISADKVNNLNINSMVNIYNEDNKENKMLPIEQVLKEEKTIEISPGTMLTLKNNKSYIIESTIAPLKDNKKLIIGIIFTFRDITLKKDTQNKLSESYQELEALYEQIAAAEEEIRGQYKDLQLSEHSLKLSEERFRLATEGCNDGIWDYNVITEELFYSDRFKEMIGCTVNGNTTHFNTFYSYICEEDIPKVQKEMSDHLKGEKPFIKFECRIRTSSDELKWVSIRGQAIWDAFGKPSRVAGSITDITEAKKNQEIIYNMAYYDALTELPNGVFLRQKYEFMNKDNLAVILVDVDNFKSVNDILGHKIGDEVLKKIANAYNSIVKENCYFFHLGGDNFCIIVDNDKALIEAEEAAYNIIKLSENAVVINNFEFFISSSIGISVYPEHGTDIETLLKNAETAMYCAKEYGKNNYFIFEESMNIRTLQKLDMEKSLRHAIRNQEFVVYYQPQISISTGKVTGMEALVRWNHPRLGFIPPMSFIPLAEETGLIIPIGEQILKIVCMQIKEWQDRGLQCVPVAVNISARQFENADILGTIDKVINETDIKSNLLEVEITETMAMSDFEYAVKILEGLKVRGIKVSLDDFGTGYSSLNYLKKLPINRVKIDKSFVNDLNSGACEEVIAEAVINIAHSMNLSVIAEGIENEQQLEFLKQKDCDIAQGYLFSRPVPNVEVEKLIV